MLVCPTVFKSDQLCFPSPCLSNSKEHLLLTAIAQSPPVSMPLQVQTTTMCISVSLSGSVVLGCLFAPKVHIILFQPQKNVTTLRGTANRFGTTVSASACASAPGSSYSKGSSSNIPIQGITTLLPDILSVTCSINEFTCELSAHM